MTTTLAPLTSENFEIVARWLSDPTINAVLSADWRGKRVTTTLIAIAVRNNQNRFFLIRNGLEPCGIVALSDLDVADKCAMVWYFMGEMSLRGKGITTEAVRKLVDIAFSEFGLECIFAWAIASNADSIKLLKTVGFQEVGRIRRSVCISGRQHDKIYFDLIRDEWFCRFD